MIHAALSAHVGNDMKTKYDWSKAPEWAQWAGTDTDLTSFWFSARPEWIGDCDSGVFDVTAYEDHVSYISPTPVGIPARTLEKRPTVSMTNALDTQVAGNHYKDFAIQPVEFCQKNGIGFCESSVIKYVCRHKNKNGAEDIRKAIHFLELLLELDYRETR